MSLFDDIQGKIKTMSDSVIENKIIEAALAVAALAAAIAMKKLKKNSPVNDHNPSGPVKKRPYDI